MSSPSTVAIFSPRMPSFFTTAITAARQALGFTPAALAMTLMPFALQVGRMRSSIRTKSVA
jgi:hypothetical protein